MVVLIIMLIVILYNYKRKIMLYADDTTVYCVGDNVDNAVTSLNVALSDLNR